ncbi:MAG: hypothetical protein KDJ41_09535 [Hyphomicrobiaceae bacterium]|nr:hypothetical protein [Hyphomicrobiaceae bacterium]
MRKIMSGLVAAAIAATTLGAAVPAEAHRAKIVVKPRVAKVIVVKKWPRHRVWVGGPVFKVRHGTCWRYKRMYFDTGRKFWLGKYYRCKRVYY